MDLYERLKCSGKIERGGRIVRCRAPTTQVEVRRIVGKGSEIETVLKLAERME